MNPVYGLVVCGGKSTRMGQDKSMLQYHGQPQCYHLYDMLSDLCERVFISCNQEQFSTIPDKYATIVDEPEYENIGPMASLLSAFKYYPQASLLVVACDYPLINENHLRKLLEVSNQVIFATSYYNDETSFYEPLLSHYQNNIKSKLEFYFKQKSYSLQSLLKDINANTIVPDVLSVIASVDTPYEYEKVLKQL
jgi:molybdenum cofactor guanylyltransferase